MIKICILFIVFCLLIPTSVRAQWRSSDDIRQEKSMRQRQVRDVYQELDLSDEQKQRLEQNRRKYHQRIKSLRHDEMEIRSEINAELQNDNVDYDRVRNLKKRLTNVQTDRTDLKYKGIMGVREILTPEQFDIFNELTP